MADKGYDKVKDNYDTSQCPGGTSTDPITPPQNDRNNAPVFNGPATKSVPENTPTTEVLLTVSATDSDSQDHVTYSKSGADESKFSLNSSGELRFSIVPDYENPQDSGTNNVYVVEVIATSGTGDRIRETTKTLTVTVTDVNEPPGRPNAPTVSADSETSLLVTWSAPANEGGPPITGYNYQYKKTSDSDSPGNWTQGTTSGLSVPIGGLEEGISYDVQIQAKNGEGESGWSLEGTGSTQANEAPRFTSSSTPSVQENTTSVLTVTAEDDDAIQRYDPVGGADASKFSLSPTGVLRFITAPNFEAPQAAGGGNNYMVKVRATSGTGTRAKTIDQTITVTVTDVDEKPDTPGAPTVSMASETSLMVRWSEPANKGPPITDYDYRYRTDSPQGNWTEVTDTPITELSVTISILDEDTAYDVQIRAKSPEGTSDWSPEGTGTTGATEANEDPRFTSSATPSVPENTTSVLTVVAVDDDSDDQVTGYSIEGGADRNLFSIVPSTGVLTFRTAPNFEAPQDVGSDNNYVVIVRATSGAGSRVRTADQTIIVTVTDETNEKPSTPRAPSVSAASETSLNVNWLAPANEGPPITDYDYRYKKTSDSDQDWTEVTDPPSSTALAVTISSLDEGTSYDVQIRATNSNGTSEWSPSGTGSTRSTGTGGNPSGITTTTTITPLSPTPGPLPEDVTLSFTRTRYEASEDDEAVTFIVQLSTTASQDAVVEYATSSGTARAGQDYEATSGTLTIPAGATRRAILVPIIDDDLDEPAEVFTIRLSNSNATIRTGKATGVIADNDLPVVIVTTNQTAVEEGETVTFTLTRIGDLSVPLVVPVSITERGEFLADGVPTRAAFAINAVETTLQVATVDDEVDEENGGVKATITEGATRRVGDATTAAVLVTDNDGPEGTGTRTDLELGEVDVTVSFTRTRYEASEDDEALVFAVTLSTLSTQTVVMKYATVSGTARAGKDYGAATGTLTFPALTTRQTIRVSIIDDNVVEEEETFTVRLRNSNATIGVGEATGVIADNDLLVVSVTTTQTVVEEGGTVEFTLTRIGDLTAPLTVPVRVTERGAFIADEDAVPTEATFAANVTTTTLQVATVDDEVEEENGAVTVTITSGATHQVGDAAAATVLVTDNDETDGVETQTDIEEVEERCDGVVCGDAL